MNLQVSLQIGSSSRKNIPTVVEISFPLISLCGMLIAYGHETRRHFLVSLYSPSIELQAKAMANVTLFKPRNLFEIMFCIEETRLHYTPPNLSCPIQIHCPPYPTSRPDRLVCLDEKKGNDRLIQRWTGDPYAARLRSTCRQVASAGTAPSQAEIPILHLPTLPTNLGSSTLHRGSQHAPPSTDMEGYVSGCMVETDATPIHCAIESSSQ
jgi:hypothetical protein